MRRNKVLLSFDIEEFDFPRERGEDISVEEGVKISSRGVESILDVLSKNSVRGTFFVTGNFAKTNPRLVRKIKSLGHEVACHGVDHFRPAKTDPSRSKKILEETIGAKVVGYRQPRMFEIDKAELRRQGFLYDSSLNPAFIPGRYNNFSTPRKLFWDNGIIEVPTSAATIFRIPLFWLALHNFPKAAYLGLAKSALKRQGYFTTYFHPWEFTDFGEWPVPWYIRRNSGKKLKSRLDWLIRELKKTKADFLTYQEFLKEWQDENKK